MNVSTPIVLGAVLLATCQRGPNATRGPSAPQPLPPTDTAAPHVASTALPAREDVTVQLVAMANAFCARVETGHVYCWGTGVDGQIGDGTLDDREHPQRAVGIDHATTLVAQNNRACVIEEGRVLCWGASIEGDRSQSRPRATPTAIPGVSDAVEISLGFPDVCVRHASGTVTCHVLYGGRATDGVTLSLPAPAIAIAGSDYVHCASTSSGVFCFRFASLLEASRPAPPPQRVMDSHRVIAVGPDAVCGTDGLATECANLSYQSPNTTLPLHATAYLGFESFPQGSRSSLCAIGDGIVGCSEPRQWQPTSLFAGLDVAAVAANRRRCALLRTGEVKCTTDEASSLATIPVGVSQPPRRPGSLTPEVAARGSVEDARVGANGRIEYCLVVRAEIGGDVSNRQCFALEPDATSVGDMATWHDPPPNAWWENDELSFQRGDDRHSFHLPITRADEGSQPNAAVNASGTLVVGILPESRSPYRRDVTAIDIASGATRFTLRLPQHLTEDYRVLGGFFVEEWANDMVDGGTFRVALFGPGGVTARTGVCIRSDDNPRCTWEIGPDAVAVLTYPGVEIFRGARARRESTGFQPGEQTAILLEDAARHRLYAIRNQPRGAVDVFDTQAHRTVRTVGPTVP